MYLEREGITGLKDWALLKVCYLHTAFACVFDTEHYFTIGKKIVSVHLFF